jgi:hypothetical protein
VPESRNDAAANGVANAVARAIVSRGAAIGRASLRTTWRGLRVAGPWLWRQRAPIAGLAARAAWGFALWMWWASAVALAGTARVDVHASLRTFALGAAVCAVVVVVAGLVGRMRHVQWAGGVLGSMHGVCAVVLWTLIAA